MPRQGDEPVPGYRLQRRLGRGSFGEVWSASGPGGTLAALKFISLSDKQGLREFRAIQRIKQIRHANLMPIIGIWLADQHGELLDDSFIANWDARAGAQAEVAKGTLYVTTDTAKPRPVELIEAMPLGDQDLFDRLEACRAAGQIGIAPDELLGYLEDAAKAIDFLNSPRHDLGEGPVAILHGDIKPQNVMLVGGSAQVCDFGLVRILGTSQATTTALAGSPAYMAPESIRDKRPHLATDQYALGITYVELRTGMLPFDAESYLEVLHAHVDGKLNLTALRGAERAVIERATALEPAARFGSTLEMVRALGQAIRVPPSLSRRSEVRSALGLNEEESASGGCRDAGHISPSSVGREQAFAVDLSRQPRSDVDQQTSFESVPSAPLLRATPGGESLRDTDLTAAAPPKAAAADPAQQPVLVGSRRWGVPTVSAVSLGAGVLITALWFIGGSQRSPEKQTVSRAVAEQPLVPKSAATLPIEHPPTPEMESVEPAAPQAGRPLNLQLRGNAPNDASLTYQYRLGEDGEWISAPSGRVHLDNLAPGELILEMRTVDELGLISEVVVRKWQVAARNRQPTVMIVEATDHLEAHNTLHLRLSGTDLDGDDIAFEWRTSESEDWHHLGGNELELAKLHAGKLSLTVRAVDAHGEASESISRTWSVSPVPLMAPFDKETATIEQSEWARHLERDVVETNSIGMKLMLVPAGEFLMGSPEIESGRETDERQHRVRITRSFEMGVYEVTQAEYERVMGKNPSWFSASGDGKVKVAGVDTLSYPVERVSWDDAQEFCRKLSQLEQKAYRLPTEAEWEYACRAGTRTTFQFGNALNGDQANCEGSAPYGTGTKGTSLLRSTVIASYASNGFGLHDMHGNVWEWCSDWFEREYYAHSPVEDPQGPPSGSLRVIRGGGWLSNAVNCRSASRGSGEPTNRFKYLGFRVVCAL